MVSTNSSSAFSRAIATALILTVAVGLRRAGAQRRDRRVDLALLPAHRDAGEDFPDVGLGLEVVAPVALDRHPAIRSQLSSSLIEFETLERASPSGSAMSSAVSGRSDR